MASPKTDILIIGGGVAGLSIARELSRYEIDVTLVEKEADVGWGQTKASYAICHPGTRWAPGTLAQALIADPELVLLDEPTDGVDPVGKIEIREVLKSIRNEGKTIFLNSHLLSEVESVADRVAILSKGKVIRSDTVDSLTRRHSQYEIVAEMGNELIDIAPEMGKRISISSSGMILELIKDDDINHIIDQLRLRGIKIKSVSPMKVSLEQSFFEAVSDPPEETE